MSKKKMLYIFILICISFMTYLLYISGAFSKIKYSNNIVGTYQTDNYFAAPYQFAFIADTDTDTNTNNNKDEGKYYLTIYKDQKQGTYKKHTDNVYILDDGEEKESIFLLNKTIHFYDKETDMVIEMDKISDTPIFSRR